MSGGETGAAGFKMSAAAMKVYRERGQRSALRCGLADAAALCDAVMRDILSENQTARGAYATKHGQKLAAIARRCGDSIWAMRGLIHHDETSHVVPNETPSTVGTPTQLKGSET